MNTVMIVDDEAAVRKALEKFLKTLDYNVRVASDGEEALDHSIEVAGVVVLGKEVVVCILGLGIAVGEEVALAEEEEGVLFQDGVGPAAGGGLEFGGRLGEFLFLEEGFTLFHQCPGHAFVGTVAGGLLDVALIVGHNHTDT